MRNFYAYDRAGDHMVDDCSELGGFEAENMDAAVIEARRLWPTVAEIRVADLSAGPAVGVIALELVNQFERAVADMFDQLVKGNWVDELGHQVRNNKAMMALKAPMMAALSLRSRFEPALLNRAGAAPIAMILHCPACGLQHIDAPEAHEPYPAFGPGMDRERWANPPHRSHLCARCGHVWRPADVPTTGVAAIKTQGSNDSGAPAAPAGRTFKITFTPRGAIPTTDLQYDLVGFCVTIVDTYGMTEAEVAAVVALQVGESFTNEDMTVRRVA